MKIPKLISAFIVLSLFLLIGYVISITLVLGNSEIQNPEYSFQLFLFGSLLLVGVIGSGLLYGGRELMKKDSVTGSSFGLFNLGEEPGFTFFKRFTAPQLTFLSVIFSSMIFLTANLLNYSKGFTGLKVLRQQFSPTQSLIFSTALIPASEEAFNLFAMGMLILFLVILTKKYKLPKDYFKVAYLGIIPLISGVIATIWHISAYSGSDINLLVVLGFWTIKNFLILATGFVVVGWILHSANNFFIDFTGIYSSDSALYFSIGLIIIFISLYVVIYRNGLFGSNRKEEIILE